MGINTFFGVPGGPVIPVFDAILTNKGAELIESRHETTATFAAMGLYRASGRVSSIVVTAGPGATNVVTGVVAAHCERTPLVVICGDVPWAATGKKLLQDTGIAGIGIERMLSGVTRAVVRIAHASSAAAQMRAAVEAALNPANPGPVLVVISVDRAGSNAVGPAIFGQSAGTQAPRPAPSRDLLEAVARHLESAQRPLVIVGAGCRGKEDKVGSLIDAIGAPFVTTPQAKGLFPKVTP